MIMEMQIKVENIKCGGCANSIRNAVMKVEGVSRAEVDVESGTITLDVAPEVKRETITSKLHTMGYPEPGKGSGLTTAASFVSCMVGRVTS
jgi:copper chaperone